MLRSYLFLFFIFVSSTIYAQTDTAAYRKIATQVQKKFAPDKRSIYFNVQFRKDTVKVESTDETVLKEFRALSANLNQQHLHTLLLPGASLKGLDYGVANISVANNRSLPQHGAELMTQMLLGTPVKVYKKQGAFYLVQTPDGYLAWADYGAIRLMDKTTFTAWQNANKIIFTADYGHAFSQPDPASLRVSDLVNGNILQVLGEEKGFYKVSFPDQRIAYVSKTQAGAYAAWVNRPNPTAAAILASAKTLIGVPYLWGGTSVKGVDCSGFTKTAYFLNGVIIPRDASQQALVGTPVDVLENNDISVDKCLKNLLPGDLLFFSAAKRNGINGGRVTHTAIYMGKGEFIQSAGMVKISSLVPEAVNYDEGQSVTLVGAKRILTAIGSEEITRVNEHGWYGKK